MLQIKLTFWTFLFLTAATQGFFLAIILLSKKNKSQGNYFLSTLIILFSITLIFYVFFWSGISSRFGFIFNLVLKLVFLFGPLAYLYVKSVKKFSLKPSDLKHFYAFPIITILSFLSLPYVNGFLKWIMPFLECSSLLFYSLLIFRVVGLNQNSKDRIQRFLIQYSILFSAFTLSYISYYILFFSGILKLEYDYAISLSMSSIIYFIGYRGYFLPEITETQNHPNDKYEKSGLTENAMRHYAGKLVSLMTREKLFTNSDLKLGDLADCLKISPHNVSQVINSSFEMSYYDFINGYRIQEAIRMMTSTEHFKDSLIGIAYSCGFNNKVSFNNAFRKFTGISPGKYRKLNPEKNSLRQD